MANNTIKVTLVRSVISKSKKQKATVLGLGLKRINSISILNDTSEIRGMISKVSHLVKIID